MSTLALVAPAVSLGGDPGDVADPATGTDPSTIPLPTPTTPTETPSQAPAPQSSITIRVPPVTETTPGKVTSTRNSTTQLPSTAATTADGPTPAATSSSRSDSPSSSRSRSSSGNASNSSEGSTGASGSGADAARERAARKAERQAAAKRAAIQRSKAEARLAAAKARAAKARAAAAQKERLESGRQSTVAAFIPPVAPSPSAVPVASAEPDVPLTAMTTLLAGLLLFVAAAVAPAGALAHVKPGAVPSVRLGVAAVGLSLVLGTLVALLSTS